jgi:hypothetical protein
MRSQLPKTRLALCFIPEAASAEIDGTQTRRCQQGGSCKLDWHCGYTNFGQRGAGFLLTYTCDRCRVEVEDGLQGLAHLGRLGSESLVWQRSCAY